MNLNDIIKHTIRKMYDDIPEYKELAKDRYEACISYDVDKMKAFQRKWAHAYPPFVNVSDNAAIAGMHKIICFIDESTPEEKEDARKWLKAHGYSEEVF